MNANYKKAVPLSLVFMCASVLCTIAACGNPENPQQPLVTAAAQGEPARPKIVIQAGGISGSYTPLYQGEQLIEILEQRSGPRGALNGHYEYQGARLMRYQGASFDGDSTLSAEFGLDGALVEARKGDEQAPEEEIVQVRRRAQLLRSHALAQQASKLHTANH